MKTKSKILIIGSASDYAIESFYIAHFKDFDLSVETFFAQNLFLEYYHKNILNKILYRIGFSNILTKINSELIHFFNTVKPDIVVVFKGMEVKATTLAYFKKEGVKLINYNPDHPFIFHGKGSGNKNVKKGIKLYDLYATYSKSIKEQIENIYKVKSFWLPFGYELDEENYINYKNEIEINEVCFVGNPDKQRALFINKLVADKIPVNVYGNDWNKWVKPSSDLKIFKPVYHDELWKTIRKYRIQLNLFRPHNVGSHNMRSFEVPAVGGIMLAPKTDEHMFFFDENTEAFYFKDLNDCTKKIKDILSMEKDEVNKIRLNARNRCLISNYSYKHRAAQLMKEIYGQEFKE